MCNSLLSGSLLCSSHVDVVVVVLLLLSLLLLLLLLLMLFFFMLLLLPLVTTIVVVVSLYLYLFEFAGYSFQVRFLNDEHEMLWTASKCLDLRRFAPAHGQEEDDVEDIYEPLKHILQWMTNRGVPNVPHVNVIYAQAKIIADNMKFDINSFYNGCARLEQACHR